MTKETEAPARIEVEGNRFAPTGAGDPMGYVSQDGTARVVYRDVNSNITEIYLLPGQTWQQDTLNIGPDAPQAAGDSMGYVGGSRTRPGSSTGTSPYPLGSPAAAWVRRRGSTRWR